MIKIGWASQDFTPVRPAMLQGQMHVRVAREAADPLTATAMAVEGGAPHRAVVLVSCDLCSVPDPLQAAVRARLASRLPAVPPEAIVMAATHTHESLVVEDGFYTWPGGEVMTPAECCDWVAERIAAVVAQAWENRRPMLVGRAFGHAVVGHNRRAVYADGSALMYGSTNRPDFAWIEGGEDHGVDLLFAWETDGRLAGVVLDIPCPAQVDEHLERFSADYWHEIRVELRHRFGQHLQVLPLCGAGGDQSPHFLLYGQLEEEMRRRRGLSERQEIAARVGDAVARALQCTHPAVEATQVAHACRQLTLAPRRVTRAERDWAEARHAEALQHFPAASWWPQRLQSVVGAFDRNEPLEPVSVEVHALRLGTAVIATNPFELYLDYGWRIKARSPAAQTIVVQLAGGSGWYLPTERGVKGMHYSAHPVVAPAGPEAGNQFVEASLELIAQVLQ
jgi:hypothetical protein